MCPSSEPIRPAGPLSGGIYVDRSRMTSKIKPRHRFRDRQETDDDQNQPHDSSDEFNKAHVASDGGSVEDVGNYDNHGRTSTNTAIMSDFPHIDKTA